MKKLLLTLTAVCTGLLSMAQLTGVVTEAYTLTNALSVQPAGTTTYRVYAECTSPTDKITAVFAILDCHPLNVSTTTTFFNDALGNVNPSGINPAFYAVFPNIEADSWTTIGAENSLSAGASDIGQAATVPADPFGPSMNTTGENLIMDDGAWFTLPTSASSLPSGAMNRVLLGQFTTDGDLSFNINVQMFVGGDQVSGRVDYVHTAGCAGAGTETGFEVGPGDAGGISGLTYPVVASCLDNEITFDMTDSFGDGWNGNFYEIFDVADPLAPVSVALGDLDGAETGDGTAVGQDILCLADGCYELVVGGGGFTGEVGWTLTGADVSPISGGAPSTTAFSINTTCPVFGCIDPLACNFDAAADTDDGSCVLPVANDLSANAITITGTGVEVVDNNAACQNEGLAGSCHFGADAEQTSVWYTFTTTADAAVSLSTSNPSGPTDSQLTVFDASFNEVACNDDDPLGGLLSVLDIACGDLPAGTYFVQFDGYNGTTGTWDLNYSIDEGACLLGCTNPAACNFDAAAVTDDGSCCLDTCVDLVVDGGGFPGEVSFDVLDGGGVIVYSGTGADGTVVLCLADGCYQIDMNDGFGDGWNGASVEMIVGGVSQGSVNLDSAPIGDGASFGTDYIDLGATGSCPVFGCTDITACNFDPAATDDDGTCIAGPCINDLPELAYGLTMDALGSCSGFVGEDMDAATVASPIATYNADDNDLWYSFMPMTSGVSLEVNTVDFDAVIEIYDASETSIAIEDVVFVNGGEILNVGDLTAGNMYLVRVSPWNPTTGPALFDICAQSIPDTRCDYGSGPYDLCDLFKADWVGADDYIFTFTSQTSGDEFVYQAGGANTFVVLSDVADLGWDDSYDVSINSVFTLADGNGNAESIEIQNDEPCDLIVNAQPLAALRASDNVANYGPHFLGDYIAATPYVCGVVDWTWEFTNIDGSQLPITHSRGAANRYMRLSDVAGLVEGAVYDCIVKPEFSNGAATLYGAVDQISIIGPAGIAGEIESPVVVAANAERLDIIEAELGMYPNPASTNVNINVTDIAEGTEIVMIDILDQTGRLVVSEQVSVNGSSMNLNMSVNDLANGMYNVRITMNGVSQVERLVIQK